MDLVGCIRVFFCLYLTSMIKEEETIHFGESNGQGSRRKSGWRERGR